MTDPLAPVDGRRRRGQDSRSRIVDAMMRLVRAGHVAPSAEQVAAQADVGLRTVFRHFQDMDSLYQEIARVVGADLRVVMSCPLQAETMPDRLIEMICRRAKAFETIAPFKRAADVFRHRSRVLGSDYDQMVVELRAILVRALPADISGDPLQLETLDMLMSFEAWSRLRREQGLSADQSQAVVEAAVRRIITHASSSMSQ